MPDPSYDRTPVALLTLNTGSTTPPFEGDDISKLSGRYVAHLVKTGGLAEDFKEPVSKALAAVMNKHPREFTQRMLPNLTVIDRMRTLASMPEEISELFEDGILAKVKTRRLFDLLTKTARDERFKKAFGMHTSTDSKKIQYGRLSIPKAASPLPSVIADTLAELAVPAVLDRQSSDELDFVHFFDHGRKPDTTFCAVTSKLVAHPAPFALAGTAAMVQPETWAILAGLGWYCYGDMTVTAGNGARTQRPNTKGIRAIKREWAWATDTLRNYSGGFEPPYGYHDAPAISVSPSNEVMEELRHYTLSVLKRPGAWDGNHPRSVRNVINNILNASKRRSHREWQIEQKKASQPS